MLTLYWQFDEVEKQKMKEKMDLNEQRRVKELETLQQKHAEVVDEIDQVFVCISQCSLNIIICWPFFVHSTDISPKLLKRTDNN